MARLAEPSGHWTSSQSSPGEEETLAMSARALGAVRVGAGWRGEGAWPPRGLPATSSQRTMGICAGKGGILEFHELHDTRYVTAPTIPGDDGGKLFPLNKYDCEWFLDAIILDATCECFL